jgi:hypothetical protein
MPSFCWISYNESMTNGVRHRIKRLLIGLIGLSLLQPVSVRALSFQVVVVETSHIETLTQCDPHAPIQSVVEALGIITLSVPSHQVSSTLQAYRQCPGITAVYVDPQTTLTLTPLDPYYTSNNQWNLSAIGAPQAWDISTGDADVIIAVIDTGVSPSDPLADFNAARLLKGVRIVNGITSVDTIVAQYSYDGGSHGTAVASLIGSQMNHFGIAGLAPGVSILPVKVFRDATYTGERVSAYNSDIAAGIVWAVDQGADILNLSLGGPSSDTATANAIAYALDHDVLIVAASGNDSDNDGSDPLKPDYVNVSYPAAYEGVIAVGSIKSNNTVSDFSNIAGNGILLSAYGEGITLPWLDNDGFYNLSGTSFSAPTVSAVLGLMLSLEPTLSPQAAIAILSGTVTDITGMGYDAGYDVWTGYGNVHAYRALLGVQDYVTYRDADNDPQSATPIYGYGPITHQLRPALDNDYYTLTLYEPDEVTFTVRVTDLQDPMITLFDADQNLIHFIDDQPNGVSETMIVSLDAGTYTVLVNDFMGRSNLNDYTLEAQFTSAALPIIELNDPNGLLADEGITYGPVDITIIESLAHTVTLTRNGQPFDWPTDGHLTQAGAYTVTVTDVLEHSVSASFTILANLAVQGISDGYAYNTDRTLTFNAEATLNGQPISSGSVVSAEGDYTLVLHDGLDSATYTFTIDKTAPVITIAPYGTTPTNQNVTILASVNEGELNATQHTFMENGTFTFMATDAAGNTAEETVTITFIIKITGITIDQSNVILSALGQTLTLSATLDPTNALEKGISWQSSDPSVITVDDTGKLTAIAIGHATITATAVENGLTDTLDVEVALTRHLSVMTPSGGQLTIRIGDQLVTSEADLPIGSVLTITATPSQNYRLYRWTLNDADLPQRDATIEHTLTQSLTLSVEFGLVGDLNATDSVSATDLVQLRRYLAGLDPISDKAIFNADLNGDGKVTTTDLVRLRRFLAGLETLIP